MVEPPEVELFVDGEMDPCSRGEDVIFSFKGFSVFGSILRGEKQEGGGEASLGKIVVTVAEDKEGGDVLQMASSDEDGKFAFSSLRPGRYAVRLSEESLQSYSFKVKEQKVTVTDDSVEVTPFVIVGYDVEGSVADSKSVGVDGVGVSLLLAGKAVTTVKTDALGKFRFSNVSRGSYSVRLQAPAHMDFDVATQEAKVYDKNVAVPPFRMASFTVNGKVLLAKGKPASSVVVRAEQDGAVQEAVTDEEGNYVVRSSCLCDLVLRAEADVARFEEVRLKVDPSSTLPTMRPKEFRVSGVVEGGELMSIQDLRVVIVKKNSADPITSCEIDSSGHFFTYVPPGTFVAEIRNDKGNKESVFTSEASSFDIRDEPVSDIVFRVARFKVSGSLKCFSQPCSEGVSLLLLGEQQPGENAIKGSVQKDGRFAFQEVRFGKYTLEVKDQVRCWADSKLPLRVDKDISGVQFSQKGTVMTVESSHPTKLVLTEAKSKAVQTFDIAQGSNVICVDGHSEMTVSANGCYRFEAVPAVVSAGTDKLSLAAKSYRVSGEIRLAGDIKDIRLHLKSNKHKGRELALKRSATGYTFDFFIEEDDVATLVPSSKEAFFEPEELTTRAKPTCQENVVTFSGKKGLFIQGKVVPPVAGVRMQVDGGFQETTTRPDGTFQIGPFAEETRAKLVATREGYSFEETEKYGVFKAQVLSSISIRVTDEKKNPIPDDAVVSISSGKNFRSSSHIKDGAVKFSSLLPGEYFVKVFLKEWVFDPKHVVIDLKENVNLSQDMTGRRVAYSLYGKVNYPNNKPASGVVILAQGSGKCSGQIEDASSSAQGTFRLRGLEPDCEYQLKPGNPDSNVFLMSQPNVTMGRKDHHLQSAILSQESPDTFHLAVLVRSSEGRLQQQQQQQQPVSRQVSVEGRAGSKIISKMFAVQQDRLTVLPALPAGAGPYAYTVSVDRGDSPRHFSPEPGSLRYLTFETREDDSRRKTSVAGGNVYFSLAVAAVIAGAAFYVRSVAEK